MRILVVGDTHADITEMRYIFDLSKENQIDVIFQVGDFYYAPHTSEGIKFLSYTSYTATEDVGIPVYFIDGNHENFDELWRSDLGVQQGSFLEILPNLSYVPRGTVWEWEGKRFAAMGGAASLDKDWSLRQEKLFDQPHTRWWPQETIKIEDVETLTKNLDNQSVDIMFSHDKPKLVSVTNNWRPFFTGYHFASDVNQEYLQTAADIAKPKILLHGHFHHVYKSFIYRPTYETTIYGLGCNGMRQNSWLILDFQKDSEIKTSNNWIVD